MLSAMTETQGAPILAFLAACLTSCRTSVIPTDYCNIYSYHLEELAGVKHFFVCCFNSDESQCHGQTYQKPGRTTDHKQGTAASQVPNSDEGGKPEEFPFCRGQTVDVNSNHWIQLETIFSNRGLFYCGGCCGQHLAANVCNSKTSSINACPNWSLCFMQQCQEITRNISAGLPLHCSVPPPPYPKHYMTETMALPTNFSVFMSSLRTQQQQLQQQQQQLWEPPEDQMPMDGQQQQPHAQQPQHPNSSVTCSVDNCKDMSMDVRCQMACCAKQCCLPDGPEVETDMRKRRFFAGISLAELMTLVTGVVALVTCVIVIMIYMSRRYFRAVQSTASETDSRILVIEDIEEQNDSDVESV